MIFTLMRFILSFLLLFLASNITFAGFNGVTHHSRANCINNESISWDWTKDWFFYIHSDHINSSTSENHYMHSPRWESTWRAAMVHWGEGKGGWIVKAKHWMLDDRGNIILAKEETVDDCSIYDGWWDENK